MPQCSELYPAISSLIHNRHHRPFKLPQVPLRTANSPACRGQTLFDEYSLYSFRQLVLSWLAVPASLRSLRTLSYRPTSYSSSIHRPRRRGNNLQSCFSDVGKHDLASGAFFPAGARSGSLSCRMFFMVSLWFTWEKDFAQLDPAEMALATLQGEYVPDLVPSWKLSLSPSPTLEYQIPSSSRRDRPFYVQSITNPQSPHELAQRSPQEIFKLFRSAGPLLSVRSGSVPGFLNPICVLDYWSKDHAKYARDNCQTLHFALVDLMPFTLVSYTPVVINILVSRSSQGVSSSADTVALGGWSFSGQVGFEGYVRQGTAFGYSRLRGSPLTFQSSVQYTSESGPVRTLSCLSTNERFAGSLAHRVRSTKQYMTLPSCLEIEKQVRFLTITLLRF